MSSRPSAYLVVALNAFQRGDLHEARLKAFAALQEVGDAADIRHLLGVICCRLGDFDAGIGHLEASFAAAPSNLEVRVMLARALVDHGQPARARVVAAGGSHPALIEVQAQAAHLLDDHAEEARQLSRLIELGPDDAILRRSLGHALARRGDFRAASAALDAAVQLDPADVETRVALAEMLADLDEPESALAAFRDASEMAPNRPDLMIGEARSLVKLRRFDDAEMLYRAVLAIAPADVECVREFGLLLERVGRFEELGPLVDDAIIAGLDPAQLSLLQSMLAFRAKDYSHALDLARAAPDDDPVRRLRLASKIHEARGHSGQAFEAAKSMNIAAPDHDRWRQRGASARSEIRRLAAAMTPDWVRSMSVDSPGERPPPAFIVGFPRSGTTLLDTFLMGHPSVSVLEEEPMLEAAKAVVGDLALLPTFDKSKITLARAAYFTDLDRRIDPSFQGLVVDKMPFNMLGAALIHRMFPDAKIIFAQRHPCDVVLSGFMQSFRLNDGMASFLNLTDAADLYDSSMCLWSASRALLPLDVEDLVYERLVEHPEDVLRKLIAFLDLEWHDELLDHQATARRRGTIITPSYDQVTQPISRTAVGRWRLVEQQMAPVLPILLPWAERLGYVPDGGWSSTS